MAVLHVPSLPPVLFASSRWSHPNHTGRFRVAARSFHRPYPFRHNGQVLADRGNSSFCVRLLECQLGIYSAAHVWNLNRALHTARMGRLLSPPTLPTQTPWSFGRSSASKSHIIGSQLPDPTAAASNVVWAVWWQDSFLVSYRSVKNAQKRKNLVATVSPLRYRT